MGFRLRFARVLCWRRYCRSDVVTLAAGGFRAGHFPVLGGLQSSVPAVQEAAYRAQSTRGRRTSLSDVLGVSALCGSLGRRGCYRPDTRLNSVFSNQIGREPSPTNAFSCRSFTLIIPANKQLPQPLPLLSCRPFWKAGWRLPICSPEENGLKFADARVSAAATITSN